MSLSADIRFMQGNEAVVEGAIAAGASFYAGYPITPSSEIAELSSILLPKVGGLFVQMEDEIASVATIIGASLAGAKSFTATSGPGFSLMQENLGVAIVAEVPCVIVNVQRSGPSTGVATKPAQGDVMQARWGTHGDHGIIVLCPASVQECFDLTIEAFNLAEAYRTPVILLTDEIIAHLQEKMEVRKPGAYEVVNRLMAEAGREEMRVRSSSASCIVPMPIFGGDYVTKYSASAHDDYGFPNSEPENTERYVRHYTDKIECNREKIVKTKVFNLEDADFVIISYGACFRSALGAMERGRRRSIKVGVLQLQTIWPFAVNEVTAVLKRCKAAFVPELNLGQLYSEILKCNESNIPIVPINRVDTLSITPGQILDQIEAKIGSDTV